MLATGIVLSIVAMLSWGFGDFLIQKNARKIGDWETLFFITLFGFVVLLPFCFKQVWMLLTNLQDGGMVLLIGSVTLLFAAIIDFEALRKGKLSIVEPIWSLEIPITSVLAYLILSERVSGIELVLIVLLLIFLVLVAFREKKITKKIFLEKGVVLAIIGALFMGTANFFIGWGARVTDPITVNFITDTFIMIVAVAILLLRGKRKLTIKDIKNNLGTLLPMSIADKVAWLAFAFSMALAPIAISTALSQSYIIVAVILGIVINKEKPHAHQKIGMVGAVIVAVILAVISSN
jgi:drug/metabolite transporter (DMT)-like permease